jgi:hypothetical protein
MLSRRLQPVAALDPKRIATLIADLDSNDFQVRQKADTELEKAGRQVAPALRQALAKQPSREAGRRLKVVIEHVERLPFASADTLRAIRAQEVLEQIGTAEAIGVLRRIAAGAAGAAETEDARAALKRLGAR